MFPSLLFAIVLAGSQTDAPLRGRVVARTLDVFDEPDGMGFITGELRRGDQIVIIGEQADGWLAIEPPPSSFCWIDRDAIEPLGDGRARVVVPQATIRAGRPGAKMPGPPRQQLAEGSLVRLIDHPVLQLRQEHATRIWRAIEPPAGAAWFVRAEGVRWEKRIPPSVVQAPESSTLKLAPRRSTQRVSRIEERAVPIDLALLTVKPSGAEGPFAPEFAQALAATEAQHRAALRRPVDQWQLEPIRQQYQDMLDHESDPAAQTALRDRLARVARQEQLAQAARKVESLLSQTRRHDLELEAAEHELADVGETERTSYDAEGLLQPSSKQVEGRRVFALVGEEGRTIAYLLVPPGLETGPLLARRVGVRGALRFEAALGNRLIRVREIEPLRAGD
jgi:hypothetical protein